MRKAFSLIELIVSIVITGITLMSVPVLLSQTAVNNNSAIIQESVMDAKTRMALVLKAPWGCFTNDADFTAFGSLQTPIFNQGAPAINFYNNNLISGEKRRDISAIRDNTAVACAGTGERLNAYAGDIPIASAAGYNRDAIVNSVMTTGIRDSININGAANLNMKEVTVTVVTAGTQSNGGGHTIALRAYSANIGDSPTILTRVW